MISPEQLAEKLAIGDLTRDEFLDAVHKNLNLSALAPTKDVLARLGLLGAFLARFPLGDRPWSHALRALHDSYARG